LSGVTTHFKHVSSLCKTEESEGLQQPDSDASATLRSLQQTTLSCKGKESLSPELFFIADTLHAIA